MAALVLTILGSFVFAAVVWLAAGSRVSVSPDQQVNDIANMVIYFTVALPVIFVAVFFVLGS